MTEAVFSAIRQLALLRPGDSVLVGFSGGADSVALLCVLLELRERLGLASVRACHFNHGLRGAESDFDEAFVREFCRTRGLSLAVERGEMSRREKPKGESIESWARALRYDFFERTARPGELIALAHNRNDCAETALINLARGTGLRGLGGIPAKRGRYIRPLLGVSRAQIEAYCASHGLMYRTDSTNADIRYARNRIRLKVLPELERVNGAAVRNISRLCAFAQQADAYLAREAARLLESARCGGGWSASALSAADPFLAACALRLAIAPAVREPDEDAVNRAAAVLAGQVRRTELAPGVYFARRADTVVVTRVCAPPAAADEQARITLGVTALPCGVSVQAVRADNPGGAEKIAQKGLNNCVDCDKINGELVLRTRRPGDRFQPARRGVTKSLKKLFSEAKLPPELRGRVAVVADSAGIVWVDGFGVAARVAAGANTEKRIVFSSSTGGNKDA